MEAASAVRERLREIRSLDQCMKDVQLWGLGLSRVRDKDTLEEMQGHGATFVDLAKAIAPEAVKEMGQAEADKLNSTLQDLEKMVALVVTTSPSLLEKKNPDLRQKFNDALDYTVGDTKTVLGLLQVAKGKGQPEILLRGGSPDQQLQPGGQGDDGPLFVVRAYLARALHGRTRDAAVHGHQRQRSGRPGGIP